ncbi:hypothetical protein J2Y46_001936 [Microbacterium sp. BE35]|uniref:polysaccharide pyruvyl transferase family protein n=1 Tax=Microbacterium sp. BE35 TaxID=2817773 RepID=UPI00286760F8|nr:polysaccharide pyruvyl transferase family protein [Microbacterium sp. BE35]MDR7189113.1 hypothetical protein [Microbacterium sp. BE35]
MFERRRRVDDRPFYLVSAAGLPNYGDEFITRAWLDWLAKRHPNVPVWLDCVEPGRANHLFADAHPLLKTTNTLWHLALSAQEMSFADGIEHARRRVLDLGSPRYDLGLLQLREAQSVHLLGGGYLNSVWEHQLLFLPALVALKERFRVPVYATGQGLTPLSENARGAVAGWLRRFDLFETRDAPSAKLPGAVAGIDDAFLAFANQRRVYSQAPTPDVMLVLQGDFLTEDAIEPLVDAVEQFVRSQRTTSVGMVESIPPDDSWMLARVRERGVDVDFYPFIRLWEEGFPAKASQTWLSTRFHFHLLAAAAGAKGAVIELRPDYYGVKHASLRELGTGWSYAGDAAAPGSLIPTGNPAFATGRERLAEKKVAVARSIYG